MEHQAKKKVTLTELIKLRHSDRIFADKPVDDVLVSELLGTLDFIPSSCNRKAIDYLTVQDRERKSFLGGVLVGGVGWIHRASHIILLIANVDAYKENLDYMKYLDAGIMVQQLYLKCTDLSLGCCYVNPNIRDRHKEYFYDYFHLEDNQTFVGGMAIGNKGV